MIKKLYGKNINFLIGSGASFGAIPTLATNYQEEGRNLTIEEQRKYFEEHQEEFKERIRKYNSGQIDVGDFI